MNKISFVKVKKSDAENTILNLKKDGKMAKGIRIIKDDDYVYIPIDGNVENFEIVEMNEYEEREPPITRRAGGYDIIGEIGIIHSRNGGRIPSILDFIIRNNRQVRTVYLDRGIRGDFRIRDLELLSGPDNPETLYRENGIRLMVNVKKAYFSPRLAMERYIVSNTVKDGERIFDMFSGIGPFTVNIGKKCDVSIIANDLNPDAHFLLKHNVIMNKIDEKVETFNEDSYNLIRRGGKFDRIILNNPMTGYSNLDLIASHLESGGFVNVYYLASLSELTERMNEWRNRNFNLVSKRIVHGYAPSVYMFSLCYRNDN
ncbi:class I SAM-dependent methyltransferase [Caldiplasma sukawensis]